MTNLERIDRIRQNAAEGKKIGLEDGLFFQRLCPYWLLYAMRERQAFSIEEACDIAQVDAVMQKETEP